VKTPAAIEGILTIATNKGNIVLEIRIQKTPVTVANFTSRWQKVKILL
jgi:cyclophilin family peptidyl-prolyl cis-trans isomerase